jgi:hypothetical protein
VSTYGLPEAELMARLSDGLPPELRGNMEAIKAEAKKQGWVKFNPKKLGDEKLVPSQFRQDEMWMPRAFNDTLTELLKEHRNKSFMKSAAVPMQVFRTSVLALSPRWHLYNIVGGAVMMTAMARNPIKTWSMLPEAWNIVKGEWKGGAGLGHKDINLPPSGKARLHEEWMQKANLSGLPVEQQATWLRNMQAGRTMRRWYDAAAKSRLARAPGKLVEKSYTANQFVDDLYRSMTYLSAQDDAWKAAMRRAKKQGIPEVAASGMARKEADMAGVRAAREVFQEWDNMTPGERTVLRFITPFYSWTRHILKVVSHFPADHPWRTSILANFAANEMEDMQSGLPQRFYELLFMGEPNEEGTQMMFNPGGMNPFRDVANYASLVGFFWGDGDLSAVTTQLNPAISTVLEGAGVDVFKGQADLYPDVEYDAATGSLKVKTQTGPLSFLGGFVPQAETLMNMAGFSAEFERMKRRDPVAAASMLVSGVGIPASFRERNLYREQMTAELRRLESQDQAKRDALKSGNYDLMDQYPGLRAMRQQIEALTPEQLAPFRPDPAMGQYGPRDLYGQMAQALIGKATGG